MFSKMIEILNDLNLLEKCVLKHMHIIIYKLIGNHCKIKNTVYFPNCQIGGKDMEVGRNKLFPFNKKQEKEGKYETKTRKHKTLNNMAKKISTNVPVATINAIYEMHLCKASNYLGLTCFPSPDTQPLASPQVAK